MIEAYRPKVVYTEESTVELADLQVAIDTSEVEDAIIIHGLLRKQQIDIPNSIQQSLLELVCWCNSASPPSEDSLEERTFIEGNINRRNVEMVKWVENGFADELFAQMEPKTAAAYNAIICGKARHNQCVKAYELYKQALSEDMALDVSTFNYIINALFWVCDVSSRRWELVLQTLQTMNERGVRPNLQTLSDVLFIVSKVGNFSQARSQCLETLAEFKRIGIEPSLGSYYYVLSIFYRDRAPTTSVLKDILNQVENKEWQPQVPADHYFFGAAMTVCRNNLADNDLAKRLHRFLHFGNNINMIGTTQRETVYYRNYLCLLLETEQFDVFMTHYRTIVPHLHSPEVGVMSSILRSIDSSGMIENLPKIWSDIVILQHDRKTDILASVLNVMAANKPIAEIASHSGLNEKFAKIAYDIWTFVETQDDSKKMAVAWRGNMTSNVMFLVCRGGDFENAVTVFERCASQGLGSEYFLETAVIEEFVRTCIVKQQPTLAIKALRFGIANGGREENIELAKLILSSFTLGEKNLNRLVGLVGSDIVDESLA